MGFIVIVAYLGSSNLIYPHAAFVLGFGPPGPNFPPNHPASISPAVGSGPPGSGPSANSSGTGNSAHPNILVPAGPPPSGAQSGSQFSSQGMPPPRGPSVVGSGRVSIPVAAPQPGGSGGPSTAGPSQNQGGTSQVHGCQNIGGIAI